MTMCERDVASGGRGVGNLAEVALVNPLARRLYELTSAACGEGKETVAAFPLAGWRLVVKDVQPPGDSEDRRYTLDLEIVEPGGSGGA